MHGRSLCLALVCALGVLAPPAAAQAGLPGDPLALAHHVAREGVATYRDPPVHFDGRYVVISLEAHRLYVVEGDRVLWDAPVGTGKGTRLESAGRKWDFSTPRGIFRIQYKEKNPVWRVPDWEFIELGQPVPPPDSPKRLQAGALGTTAMYLEEDVAVHGTNHPELLGQSVSHGCIRMTNEAARRLFHQVDVGTPVVIY
jgi:L,D-transpeptidase YbiS